MRADCVEFLSVQRRFKLQVENCSCRTAFCVASRELFLNECKQHIIITSCMQLESDAPAQFEGPIGKFDGPKELFSELRNPELDNYTTLLPPEGLAFSLRTAYELGDVIWRDSLRTVLLHVTRGTHNVPELVDMARQGR